MTTLDDLLERAESLVEDLDVLLATVDPEDERLFERLADALAAAGYLRRHLLHAVADGPGIPADPHEDLLPEDAAACA